MSSTLPNTSRFSASSLTLFLVLGLAAACSEDVAEPEPDAPADPATQPLSDLNALFSGVPNNSDIPEDGKFDAVYPAQFDVTDTLTPVRSQGARGTCSIFASIALMEQLYAAEGTLQNPDFSEQFLQWSTKVELGIFPNTAGSNAGRNLDAINRFGVVTEDVYPYESSEWNASDDPACTGSGRPTRCYTNGDPSDEVLNAQRWELPPGRYVNCRPRSIKAYMTEKGVGVTASVAFFYQAWNHGGSKLRTNSAYSRAGYVTYPSPADIADSELRPAGHAFLLVGWDDELEVPLLDENGQPRLDENGEPMVERGFYLFKNSWGTNRFGVENPFGAGLGWISQRYIEEYGSCHSSSIPTVTINGEICNNRIDDDGDGDIDCDDSECANDPVCRDTDTRNVGPGGDIPDNTPGGLESSIVLTQEGIVEKVFVSVDATHTYRGDLQISLRSPDGTQQIVLDRQGGSDDDVNETFLVPGFEGKSASGAWTLVVADLSARDTGRLNTWTIELKLAEGDLGEDCTNGVDDNGDGAVDCDDEQCAESPACGESTTLRAESAESWPIPDNDPEGDYDLIELDLTGLSTPATIGALRVEVVITHPSRGDLTVKLESETGEPITLFDQEDGDADDLIRTFEVDELVGEPITELWGLHVIDNRNLDEGIVERWAIEIDPATD